MLAAENPTEIVATAVHEMPLASRTLKKKKTAKKKLKTLERLRNRLCRSALTRFIGFMTPAIDWFEVSRQ